MTNENSDSLMIATHEAVSIMHDIFRGRSRSFVRFVSSVLEAYQNTDMGFPEGKADAILMDLARLVKSQSRSPENQEHRLATCEHLLLEIDQGTNLADLAKKLSRPDLASLRDMTKFFMHVGLMHFDRIGDEIGVYVHMYESGVLLENSAALERGRSSPGIRNPAVPANIKTFYECHKVLSDAYDAQYRNAPSGPGY